MHRSLILDAPVGIIITDVTNHGLVKLANPAAAAIFNSLPEAIIGQNITMLGSDSGFEALLVATANEEQATAAGLVQGEIILGDVEGARTYIRATLARMPYEDETAIYWWLEDISDIRRTEEEWRSRERQLHAVIDAAQDAVFEIHLDTGGAIVSPRFWQMLGKNQTDAVNMQHTSSEDIYHYVRDDHQLSFASSLRPTAQEEPYEWTGAFHTDLGDEVWLYMRGRITDLATEPRIIGVITDISAQKSVEENLRKAKEAAEEANRAKSAFLATMSHEIRTPMTAILGSLEYLLDTPLIKEQHKMASIARDSGQSLLAILNDILDLSKIEAGKLTLEALPTSPRSLVQGACDAAQIMARHKNIYLRCRFAEPPPSLMLVDPTRVRQLLMNLVNNAVKFTEQGGVTVMAHYQKPRLAGEPPSLRVVVQDSGIGMSDEQQTKLFRAFSQADDSTTRKFGGTGLGLSICQKLVERMGGQMGAYSRKGQGSAFWFNIPVGVADEQAVDINHIDLKGLSILLADNDPESARQTATQLEEVGGRVTLVSDGKSVLQALMSQPYSLLLLEQVLPDIKGLTLVPAIRALVKDMSIVLYTSEEPETIGWVAQEAGAAYLSRTIPYQQFLETIQSYAIGAPILEAKRTGRLNGRVLIAEDTASVRQILEVQTKGLGLDVEFAENGRIALDKMLRGRYDLVISDLHMPEVDGYGLVHEWREREQKRGRGEHLPIVALTADVLIGDQNKFIAEGFDDYMAKPVSRDALRNLIAKWLSSNIEGTSAAAPEVVRNDNQEASSVAQSNESDTGYKPVDHDRLIEILGLDDPEILAEAMDIFMETARETFAALEKAYQSGDVAAAKGPAHSLKGSARMAGATQLGDLAAALDAAAKQGELIPDGLEACRAELALVLDYVARTYLPKAA
jgi:two-component system sensor histidine kinase/response regulator